MKKFLAVAGLTAVVTLTLAGCGGDWSQHGKDAPIAGTQDESAAETYSMPDGFSNFSEKCDHHGHRVFVAYHGTAATTAIAVIDDPSCGK